MSRERQKTPEPFKKYEEAIKRADTPQEQDEALVELVKTVAKEVTETVNAAREATGRRSLFYTDPTNPLHLGYFVWNSAGLYQNQAIKLLDAPTPNWKKANLQRKRNRLIEQHETFEDRLADLDRQIAELPDFEPEGEENAE